VQVVLAGAGDGASAVVFELDLGQGHAVEPDPAKIGGGSVCPRFLLTKVAVLNPRGSLYTRGFPPHTHKNKKGAD
jgi:hypothetical protein